MATNNQADNLLMILPDEVLLNIFFYLPISGRLSLQNVNERFANIIKDSCLMRFVSASHDWTLEADAITEAFQHGTEKIQHLELTHCYWLQSNTIAKCLRKCPNLIKLDLRGCSVTPKDLDKILCVTTALKHLAVTDPGMQILEFVRRGGDQLNDRIIDNLDGSQLAHMMSSKACKTLQELTELILLMEGCTKRLYILDLCRNITSLSVLCQPTRTRFCTCRAPIMNPFLPKLVKIHIDPLVELLHFSLYRCDALQRAVHTLAIGLNPESHYYDITSVDNPSRQQQMEAACSFLFVAISNSKHIRRRPQAVREMVPLPATLQCLHLDYNPQCEFRNRIQKTSNESFMPGILSRLTGGLTCLQVPLQLTSKENEAKHIYSDCMIKLQSVCSHLKHLDVIGSFCHMFKDNLKDTKTLMNNCADEAWDTIAENVSKDLVSLSVPPCFVLDNQSICKLKKPCSSSSECQKPSSSSSECQKPSSSSSECQKPSSSSSECQKPSSSSSECQKPSSSSSECQKPSSSSSELKKPSSSANEFQKPSSSSSEMEGFGQRQRVGTPTSSYHIPSRFEKCVQSCPNLERFVLMPWSYIQTAGAIYLKTTHDTLSSICVLPHLIKDGHLFSISKWKHLTSLTLAWLPGILHGKWLIEIAKGCSRLRYLSLAYIGLHAGCVYKMALCEALKYAKNLQDLRIEQPNMLVNPALCRAMMNCSMLTRLCLVTHRCREEFSHQGILNVFQECEKLCVFHLITSCSKVTCDRLTTDLKNRYKKERPALNIFIRTGADKFDKLENVPYVHISEMMMLRSHTCYYKPVS